MGEPPPVPPWRSQVPPLLLAALAAGVAVRVLLLALPPLFVTDVSYYNVQGASYLLRGVDPYGASYSVPAALATPGAENVFAYLPGVFAFIVPGALGDGARLGLVACDLIVAASLVLFRPRSGGLVAVLFLLLPPVVLFSTAFLNDSLPAIAFVSLAILLEARGRSSAAGALLGAALASSQEAWFVFPVYAAYSFRRRKTAPPLAALAVCSAAVAPFFAWDPSAFASNVLYFQLQRVAPPFLYTGPFGLSVNPSLQGLFLSVGATAPLVARLGLAVAFLAFVIWRSKDTASYLLWGSAASVAVCLFLLAGDFFWSYLELPFVLLLFWAAPRLQSLTAP